MGVSLCESRGLVILLYAYLFTQMALLAVPEATPMQMFPPKNMRLNMKSKPSNHHICQRHDLVMRGHLKISIMDRFSRSLYQIQGTLLLSQVIFKSSHLENELMFIGTYL
jgi:hypothetical protein